MTRLCIHNIFMINYIRYTLLFSIIFDKHVYKNTGQQRKALYKLNIWLIKPKSNIIVENKNNKIKIIWLIENRIKMSEVNSLNFEVIKKIFDFQSGYWILLNTTTLLFFRFEAKAGRHMLYDCYSKPWIQLNVNQYNLTWTTHLLN